MLLSTRVGELLQDEALQKQILAAPSTALAVQQVVERAEAQAFTSDRWLYRWAVAVLGLLALSAATGAIALAWAGKGSLPEIVISLGSTAVGALVGLFAPSPTNR